MRLARFKAALIGSSPIPKTVVLDVDRFAGGFWNDTGAKFIAMFAEVNANFEFSRDEAETLLRAVSVQANADPSYLRGLLPAKTETTASGIKLA